MKKVRLILLLAVSCLFVASVGTPPGYRTPSQYSVVHADPPSNPDDEKAKKVSDCDGILVLICIPFINVCFWACADVV